MENQEVLDKIANTLIEKEKIDGIELLTVIKDLKPDLVPKGAFEAIDKILLKQEKATQGLQPAAMTKTELK